MRSCEDLRQAINDKARELEVLLTEAVATKRMTIDLRGSTLGMMTRTGLCDFSYVIEYPIVQITCGTCHGSGRT